MDNKMKDRLDTILQRCTYLEKMMELPTVASDFQRYKMYAKEHSNLEEVANAYKEYKSIEQNMEEALLLVKDEEHEIA